MTASIVLLCAGWTFAGAAVVLAAWTRAERRNRGHGDPGFPPEAGRPRRQPQPEAAVTRIWRPGRRWRVWTTTTCHCCSGDIRTPRPPEGGWHFHRGQPVWYCPDCLGRKCSYSLAHTAGCTCPVPDEAKR